MSDPARSPAPRTTGAVLAGVLLGGVLFHLLSQRASAFDPDAVGLGKNTLLRTAFRDGVQVSGWLGDVPERPPGGPPRGELRRRAAIFRSAGRRVALWLGASQLHAINHLAPTDRLAVERASERAAGRGSNLAYLQVSAPNATLDELFSVYVAFRHPTSRPDRLILGFTFDDLQHEVWRIESALDAAPFLPDDLPPPGPGDGPGLVALREQVARVRERCAQPPEWEEAPVARSATAGTPQDRLERELVARIEAVWPAWAGRHRLRSAVIAAGRTRLDRLRVATVGRGTIRVAPERVEAGKRTFLALLELLARDGVRLLCYRAPYNPTRFLHDRAAHDAMTGWVRARVLEAGQDWVDLEGLVPDPAQWGKDDANEPDPFHFTGEGHRLLGRAIDERLEALGE